MTEWSREQRYRRIEDVNKDELEALKHRIEQSSYRQHFHIQPETGLLVMGYTVEVLLNLKETYIICIQVIIEMKNGKDMRVK